MAHKGHYLYKLYFPRTNFIFLVQTLFSSYKLYYHRPNFIFLVETLCRKANVYINLKLFICHTNVISIGKLYIDLQTLNLPVAALLVILYAQRDVSNLGLSRAQGPNVPAFHGGCRQNLDPPSGPPFLDPLLDPLPDSSIFSVRKEIIIN